MPDLRLMPLSGINNTSEDAALVRGGEDGRVFVRDAVNVNFTPAGKLDTRDGTTKVSSNKVTALWQSPLHGDVFAVIGGKWGKLNSADWTVDELADAGAGDVSHIVLNNQVCVATGNGIYLYNGITAERLVIDTPPAPLVITDTSGSLTAGKYGVAISWLRNSKESALSAMSQVELDTDGSLQVNIPASFDNSISHFRIYMTKANGSELLRQGQYVVGVTQVDIPAIPQLGEPAKFQHLSPMPTGKYLCYWRGRIITATANIVRFSEAMTYHLHSERHGFVQMGQRVTFVQPVDGGIWIGQVDHVVFLSGVSLDELSINMKSSKAPIPGSAIQVKSEVIGGELSQGADASVLWLSENGYVVGTAQGQLVELHAGTMKGISGGVGTSVVIGKRVLTVVG